MSESAHQMLTTLLQQEHEALSALVETLEREHALITQRQAAELEALASVKESQLNALNGLARQRSELLLRAGVSDDKAGFMSLLQDDTSGELAELWQTIERQLHQCQDQNQINGQLLEANKKQAQELLALLLGRESGHNTLYDQQGNTSSSLGQGTSVKA
ncbi:MAG: flagella synthesis protein FlgN [Pseudomonadota bacterium]